MILSCYGGKMEKILLMVLILVCMFNAGCTKQDDFEHYALSDRDLNVYIYSNNGYDEVYALADLTVQNLEETRTGLFYKVANNDYILLNTLTSNKIDAYKMKSVYQFYGDKLYGIGNGEESPMMFEIDLNGKNSKMKELKYNVEGKINPFLVGDIRKISNDEISYYGTATIDGKDSRVLINCSTSAYECTISRYE